MNVSTDVPARSSRDIAPVRAGSGDRVLRQGALRHATVEVAPREVGERTPVRPGRRSIERVARIIQEPRPQRVTIQFETCGAGGGGGSAGPVRCRPTLKAAVNEASWCF
jgi:hypothetical protein